MLIKLYSGAYKLCGFSSKFIPPCSWYLPANTQLGDQIYLCEYQILTIIIIIIIAKANGKTFF